MSSGNVLVNVLIRDVRGGTAKRFLNMDYKRIVKTHYGIKEEITFNQVRLKGGLGGVRP